MTGAAGIGAGGGPGEPLAQAAWVPRCCGRSELKGWSVEGLYERVARGLRKEAVEETEERREERPDELAEPAMVQWIIKSCGWSPCMGKPCRRKVRREREKQKFQT